jgi:6-pyruvoyltetrahydropterin/6-carboxytetrahydropterin synthase
MTEYRICVSKDSVSFAAGHFITYGGGACETLHGHNYRMGVTLVGGLDQHSLLYDFVALKRDIDELVGELDHRMLLPTQNEDLQLTRANGEIEVQHADRRYVFPEADVVLLPIANTTAERLAEYVSQRLEERLSQAGSANVGRIEVEVEESFGFSAYCVRDLGA